MGVGLGLNMNLKKITLMLLLSGSIVSCIKQPEVVDDTPSTAEEVENTVAEAWGDADPLSMKQGDFIYQVTEQTVENNPKPIFSLFEGITIDSKVDRGADYLYTYTYQHATQQGEEESSPQATRQDTRKVGKATSSLATAMTLDQKSDLKPMADDYHLSLGFEKVYGLAYSCIQTEGLTEYCKKSLGADTCELKCANLKVTEMMMPVPEQVKLQANCGGYENCMWRTKMVAFDWILSLKKDGATENKRINYLVTVSPDLPFFARMTSYCYRQVMTLSTGQRILVSSCTKLNNYRPGPVVANTVN